MLSIWIGPIDSGTSAIGGQYRGGARGRTSSGSGDRRH
jgi:hypothetical protein